MKSSPRHFYYPVLFVCLGVFLQGCQFSGPAADIKKSPQPPLPAEYSPKAEYESKKPDFGPWEKFVTQKKDGVIYFKIPSRGSFRRQVHRIENRFKRQKYEKVREVWKRSQTPKRVVIDFQKNGKRLKLDIRQKIEGRIVLVIDDVGHNRKWLALLEKIDRPMTLAVLPFMPYSRQMSRLQGNGFEIILHLPMENLSGLDPGPGAILTEMTDEEIRQKVDEALESVPGAVGANNHMGSKATADERVMGIILEKFHEKGLIFLDSLTGSSAGSRVAREKGIFIHSRDVFLDDEADLEYIENQLLEVKKIAARRGEAIGIGHFKENTLLAIGRIVSQFEDEGFQFVFLSSFYPLDREVRK